MLEGHPHPAPTPPGSPSRLGRTDNFYENQLSAQADLRESPMELSLKELLTVLAMVDRLNDEKSVLGSGESG